MFPQSQPGFHLAGLFRRLFGEVNDVDQKSQLAFRFENLPREERVVTTDYTRSGYER